MTLPVNQIKFVPTEDGLDELILQAMQDGADVRSISIFLKVLGANNYAIIEWPGEQLTD